MISTVPSFEVVVRNFSLRCEWHFVPGAKACDCLLPILTRSTSSGARFTRGAEANAGAVATTSRPKATAAASIGTRGIARADDDRDVGCARDLRDFVAHRLHFGDRQLFGDLFGFRLAAVFEHHDGA